MNNGNYTPGNESEYRPEPKKSILGFITLGLGIIGLFNPIWSVAAIICYLIDTSVSGTKSRHSEIGLWLGIAALCFTLLFTLICVLLYVLFPGFAQGIADSLPELADIFSNMQTMYY